MPAALVGVETQDSHCCSMVLGCSPSDSTLEALLSLEDLLLLLLLRLPTLLNGPHLAEPLGHLGSCLCWTLSVEPDLDASSTPVLSSTLLIRRFCASLPGGSGAALPALLSVKRRRDQAGPRSNS